MLDLRFTIKFVFEKEFYFFGKICFLNKLFKILQTIACIQIYDLEILKFRISNISDIIIKIFKSRLRGNAVTYHSWGMFFC